MKFILRKHVASGVGDDLFLKKDIELTMAPSLGMQLAWADEVEEIIEIIYNLDTDVCSLWAKPDTEMSVSATRAYTKEEALQKLAQKMREYQNSGWNLQR